MRTGLALIIVMLAAVPAMADDLSIHLVGSRADGGATLASSEQPTAQIRVDLTDPDAKGATSVGCGFDGTAEGPYASCGTQVTSGCPVSQCWEYSPALGSGGDHKIGAALLDADGHVVDALNLPFTVDTTPPDTTLSPGPPEFGTDQQPQGAVLVGFSFAAVDDADQTLFEDTFQCAFTGTAAPPAAWTGCYGKARRRPISPAVWRYWVRAVDVFGRPDPTPAVSAPFSPVPCTARVVGGHPTLAAVRTRGLRLRVRCIQASRFTMSLTMTEHELERLNQADRRVTDAVLGQAQGRTTSPMQTRLVTLRLRRGIPSTVFAARHLPLDVAEGSQTGLVGYARRVVI